jgi:hypothetical protein
VKVELTTKGAKCGSTTIDRNFHSLMGYRFGDAFKKKTPKEIGHGSQFMRDFEYLKRSFDGCVTEDLRVRLAMEHPDCDHYKFGEISLTGYGLSMKSLRSSLFPVKTLRLQN